MLVLLVASAMVSFFAVAWVCKHMPDYAAAAFISDLVFCTFLGFLGFGLLLDLATNPDGDK